MKYLVGMLCCLFLIASTVHADVLCVRKRMKANRKSGVVNLAKAFKTVGDAEDCPKRFTTLVDTSVFKGDTGAKGDPGEDGVVDLSTCVTETVIGNICSEGSICATQLSCGAGNGSAVDDYMVNYTYTLSNDAAYVATTVALTPSGESYPTGIRIRSTSETGEGAHAATLSTICCSP